MAKDYAKAFYSSKAWLACRDGYISSVHALCERCLAKERHTPGYIVHHKIPITPENISNPEVTLNWDNLEYMCQECHNHTHYGTSATRDDVMFENNGDLIER